MNTRLHPWQYAGMSPMQRTLAWLRDRGYVVAVVERWLPGAKVRRDCFGADVLAAHPADGIVLVQVCGADVAAHVAKLKVNEEARTLVEAGGEVLVMGWRELRAAGGWTPRVWSMNTDTELALEDVLQGVVWQPALVRQ